MQPTGDECESLWLWQNLGVVPKLAATSKEGVEN